MEVFCRPHIKAVLPNLEKQASLISFFFKPGYQRWEQVIVLQVSSKPRHYPQALSQISITYRQVRVKSRVKASKFQIKYQVFFEFQVILSH